MSTERRYYAQRAGRGPKVDLDLPRFARLLVSVWDDFKSREYFQYGFGYDCVDRPDPEPGKAGMDPNSYFFRELERDDMWPWWQAPGHSRSLVDARWKHWDEDELLDMAEALHELVAFPVSGRYHDFAGCGWHYTSFDVPKGQREYRDALNKVLGRHTPPLKMNEVGEIYQVLDADMEALLDRDLPTGTPSAVEDKVQVAIDRFRSRGSTIEDRHAAVRDLADVLERMKPEIQARLTRKDESDLFQLANKFGIRHYDKMQKTDYDRPVWLSWLFYHYLSTIHAVTRLSDKEGM